VETLPFHERFVVPLRPPSEARRTSFLLGRTMCTPPNVDLDQLDRPIRMRILALRADGSTAVGRWQTISPPPDYVPGAHDVAYVVEVPEPEVPPASDPSDEAAACDVVDEPAGHPHWLWFLLAVPGALAALWLARARA
jgi:hypothetical protein